MASEEATAAAHAECEAVAIEREAGFERISALGAESDALQLTILDLKVPNNTLHTWL